jgi:hypothetical protein
MREGTSLSPASQRFDQDWTLATTW